MYWYRATDKDRIKSSGFRTLGLMHKWATTYLGLRFLVCYWSGTSSFWFSRHVIIEGGWYEDVTNLRVIFVFWGYFSFNLC